MRRSGLYWACVALFLVLGCGEGVIPGVGASRGDPWTLTVHDGNARVPDVDEWPNPLDCALRWDGATLRARCDDQVERAVPAAIAEPVIAAVLDTDWDDVEPMDPDDLDDGDAVDRIALTRDGETYRGSVRTVADAVYRLRLMTWGPGAACERDADCRRFPCHEGLCASRCDDVIVAHPGCGPLSIARRRIPDSSSSRLFTCLDPITCEPMP